MMRPWCPINMHRSINNIEHRIYVFRSIIIITFDFLRNSINYFDHLCIELYISKNYEYLYYESMRLDDSNKISLN